MTDSEQIEFDNLKDYLGFRIRVFISEEVILFLSQLELDFMSSVPVWL